MTVRESIADDTLSDYRVPAGTVIYVLANAINRLPMYWGPTADDCKNIVTEVSWLESYQRLVF
jgi:cytochrome P450